MRASALAPVLLAAALPVPRASAAEPDPAPVVLTGAAFGAWAAPADVAAKAPFGDAKCQAHLEACRTSHYAEPDVRTSSVVRASGADVDRISAWRWTGRWVEVPVQVDEVFTRYLDDGASSFSTYSGQDAHTTYAFDREGFRWTRDRDRCHAAPDSPVARDPVPGLDTDDEVAFMASDAGAEAPAEARLPSRVTDVAKVAVGARFVYVMLGRAPGFTAATGYVRYARAADADVWAESRSADESYGPAATGVVCDARARPAGLAPRRPRDGATVTTSRYAFRYDGRWRLTSLRVNGGRDLLDRWKGRALGETEEANWEGSSVLLGEKVGPVRAIRETWGADSGTNVVRRETFYRDTIEMRGWWRVHAVPPDGLYGYWDMARGSVDRYYTPYAREGVAIDGRPDDVTATHPWLAWSVTSGPYGSLVDSWQVRAGDVTPGGYAQFLAAVPYYRDDAATGDVGAHGVHLLFMADGDNARLTVPVTEVVTTERIVVLSGRRDATAGDAYAGPAPVAYVVPRPGP